MNLQNVRWPILAASVAVTLAALFGGGFVFKSRTVDAPLETLYEGTSSVQAHVVELIGDRYDVKLTLGPVTDLAKAYTDLDEGTAAVLQRQPYRILLEDRRTPELEQLYGRLHLYVQEALATGKFASMAAQIEQEAAAQGATARLSVDNKRVYVQLNNADGYLYAVVERHPAPTLQPRQEGGGML